MKFTIAKLLDAWDAGELTAWTQKDKGDRVTLTARILYVNETYENADRKLRYSQKLKLADGDATLIVWLKAASTSALAQETDKGEMITLEGASVTKDKQGNVQLSASSYTLGAHEEEPQEAAPEQAAAEKPKAEAQYRPAWLPIFLAAAHYTKLGLGLERGQQVPAEMSGAIVGAANEAIRQARCEYVSLEQRGLSLLAMLSREQGRETEKKPAILGADKVPSEDIPDTLGADEADLPF